jgi:hypothetical protein
LGKNRGDSREQKRGEREKQEAELDIGRGVSLMIEGIKLGLGCEYRRQGDQPE